MPGWRIPLVAALLLNLAILFTAIVCGGAILGFAGMHVLGFYSEMDHAGVIDHQRLAEFRSGQFAGPWYAVPEHFVHSFGRIKTVLYGIGTLALLNCVCMLVLWRRLVKTINR